MYGYVVRKGERPEQIASALRVDYNALMDANKGGVDARGNTLRQQVVGKDMETGQIVRTFLPADWKEGVTLRIPQGYSGSVGEIPAGLMGYHGNPCDIGADCESWETCVNGKCYDPMMDPANITAANQCTAAGGTYNYQTKTCSQYTTEFKSAKCTDPAMIVAVQKELIKNGYDLGPTGADGIWGCLSQKALEKSGYSYREWGADAGWSACDDPVPFKANCPKDGPPPVTTKKKEGESCTDSSQCEAGLQCVNGKCAKVQVTPPVNKKTGWGTYLGIGLAIAAGAVGIAYVASDKDKKRAQRSV